MSFDFEKAQLKDEVYPMAVKHPATGETIATIGLISIDSPRPKLVTRTQEKKRIQSRNMSRAFDPSVLEAEHIEVLAACTASWSGVMWKGEPLACTPDNAKMLYEKVSWLREEVSRTVSDPAFFLDSSPASSENSSEASSS